VCVSHHLTHLGSNTSRAFTIDESLTSPTAHARTVTELQLQLYHACCLRSHTSASYRPNIQLHLPTNTVQQNCCPAVIRGNVLRRGLVANCHAGRAWRWKDNIKIEVWVLTMLTAPKWLTLGSSGKLACGSSTLYNHNLQCSLSSSHLPANCEGVYRQITFLLPWLLWRWIRRSGLRFISFPKRPDQLWGPTQPPTKYVPGFLSRDKAAWASQLCFLDISTININKQFSVYWYNAQRDQQCTYVLNIISYILRVVVLHICVFHVIFTVHFDSISCILTNKCAFVS
jgi:hypothetical protein